MQQQQRPDHGTRAALSIWRFDQRCSPAAVDMSFAVIIEFTVGEVGWCLNVCKSGTGKVWEEIKGTHRLRAANVVIISKRSIFVRTSCNQSLRNPLLPLLSFSPIL